MFLMAFAKVLGEESIQCVAKDLLDDVRDRLINSVECLLDVDEKLF